jgi:glyoxylase I family protein
LRKFYTQVLGFRKSKEIAVGEFKWLTLISPNWLADIKLVLEPNANPAPKQSQEAIFKQGIPITAFEADDIHSEFER